ncbi:transporter substrate-binding domain-containing protein [Pelagibacterium xiamenense]|uniref:transporter substrate-binding domain-containing protein n=1 Tax=Pelagibacterium xiamenense TaxID=2901140 RepID=UPI001E4CC83D|nr:transporter substrate-binding domain-containing protein [Pelagibacterium xiamenense]MCD7059060.1 transporter substrate-binding domain-containing protein [Pelagibacterium xiamenense]
MTMLRVLTGFVLALALAPAGILAQALPLHVDPGAREDLVDPQTVPALRFLTTTDFPPFNYEDGDGALIGYNVDLARAICGVLTARCTIQAWPWDRAQQALADNQGDALIAGLAITEASGERFDFSRIYLQLPARFVTARADAGAFDAGAYEGAIGVRAGSAHADLLADMRPDLEQVAYPTEFAALEALAAGETGAVFVDGMRASFWLNDNPGCCAFAGEPYFRPDYFGAGLSIAVPAGLDNVRTALNWALVRLARDGRMAELYLRWFPVGFY